MKFVLAGYGSRGDVEPCAALARELQRRGHEICMAVPPNMIAFAESAGLSAVAYGPDSREAMNPAADFIRDFSMKLRNPLGMLTEITEHVNKVKTDKGATLKSLAEGADLILAGFNEQGLAANVAEYYGIPSAALHFFPSRIWSSWGLFASITKETEDVHRRSLGLPESPEASAPVLQIQAYEELGLPALAADSEDPDARRPFVGALTLELPTDVDDEVMSWIGTGTPPIYFGFGSTPLESAVDAVDMIGAACAQMGERALVCSGPNDFVTGVPQFDHVKVVDAVNHSVVFPACRALVHHGGAGTTAAGIRAGVPSLILWQWLDQPVWADAVKQLGIGLGRLMTDTSDESLISDLRTILTPQGVARAREVAAKMTTPGESVAAAADLLEDAARSGKD